MVNVFLRILFLVILLQISPSVFCQSPCSKYFRYYRDEFNEIMAIIEIPSPPKGVPLMLKVTLTLPKVLSKKYLGRLELLKSKRESVQMISEGKSLFYRVRFPHQGMLPILTGIALNNVQYCIGPRAIGPIINFIYLEHTLYPPGIISILCPQNFNQPLNPSSLPEDLHPPTVLPVENLDYTSLFSIYSDKQYLEPNATCGISKNWNPSDVRGKKTHPGDWPWLVAIFFAEINFNYQCVGNLISRNHVLTAAHCLKAYGMDALPNWILISMGRYSLEDWNEPGTVNREVSEIRIHPDFNNLENADADLAVLVLRKSVDFTLKIQPICLWSGPKELEKIVGETGYVVGWDKYEQGQISEEEPQMMTAPIVSQEDCLRSNAAFVEMTSKRTFCAGNRNGTGPCDGYSGSGFALLDPETGRYFLRGIASLSILDQKSESCDLNEYIVYVDTAKHHDWIVEQISSDPA